MQIEDANLPLAPGPGPVRAPGGFKRGGGFRRKRVCRFCVDKIDYVDYKDVPSVDDGDTRTWQDSASPNFRHLRQAPAETYHGGQAGEAARAHPLCDGLVHRRKTNPEFSLVASDPSGVGPGAYVSHDCDGTLARVFA